MTKLHFTRYEIGALAERCEARGTSRMLRDRPELCRDLNCAAAILRWMLEQGIPVTGIDLDVTENCR